MLCRNDLAIAAADGMNSMHIVDTINSLLLLCFAAFRVGNQMKLFQQLLVAPAALGLMAPMAANAADLDIKGVSDYSASSEQVTSISQFQDVYPTDWAYQALSNLIERYGCVAGYPSGSYLGNRAMTRFEAAALLNACLDRITEVTDELRRLLEEFEQELAILKGRVDGLEARVGELEATQFSTTTKLVGQTSLISRRLKEAWIKCLDQYKYCFNFYQDEIDLQQSSVKS